MIDVVFSLVHVICQEKTQAFLSTRDKRTTVALHGKLLPYTVPAKIKKINTNTQHYYTLTDLGPAEKGTNSKSYDTGAIG